MSKMNKREFITEVSKRTNLRRDVVEDVFKGITDLAIEEIVNTGEFALKDVFSVTSRDWKGYSLAGIEVKPQKRLSIRLSERIKSFWKLKNEHYPDSKFTRDEWDAALRHHKSGLTNKTKANRAEIPSQITPRVNPKRLPASPPIKQPEDFNPLLDEDD